MKTKFLPVLLILSGLLVTADKTYACNDPPNADLDASPNPVCVDCNVTLDGSGSSDPDGEITKYEWDWTNNGSYDYYETSSHYPDGEFDGETTHIYTIAGTYTAKLRVTDDGDATDTDTCQVSVVKVDKIQYNDPDTGYTDVSGTLYVHKGTTVTFKAIKDPSGASWPSGKPVWGGTSGASGTGETKGVTFNTLSSSTSDYKTVTAECGNTVTANVIVFDFNGVLTPDDNFPGRDQEEYGLEEVVDLSCTIDPSGLTAGTVGGLKWTYIGVGELSNAGTDGTADYDAKHVVGGATFYLTIQSGPSKDDYKSYNKSTTPPSGGYMIQKPGTGVRHTVNTCSAGFLGISYITPKNVSFTNLETREGYCLGIGTGFYSSFNGDPHATGSWNGVDDGDINNGCKEDYPQDEIWTEQGPPYSIGDFVWPIPVEYKADDGVVHTLTANQNHHEEADANGKCTISKYGAGPFSKNASDPNSSW